MVDGEVVVRTPKGDRALRTGDIACFPPGEEGAHQVRNDSDAVARFAMPSSWAGDGYDGNPARQQHRADRRPRLPADRSARRGPRLLGPRAVSEINLFDVAVQADDDDPDGYHTSYARIGPLIGGRLLGLSVYELPPGQSICPYHYEIGYEEWLFVLIGPPTLRTPDGERELRAVGRRVLPRRAETARTR